MGTNNQINNYIVNDRLDLNRIIKDYTPYVKTIINNMVYNNLTDEDKEEILSDVFFVFWKNRFKEIPAIDAFIAGITRNLVREKLRKKVISLDIADYENNLGYTDIDMFDEKREKIEKVKEKMKELSDIEVKIIDMFYYYSKSTKEIANELNLTETNVRSKLHRIRKKIKRNFI